MKIAEEQGKRAGKSNARLEKLSMEKARAHMRIVAHDLRNPISGILSASEYLLEDHPDAEEEHGLLLRAIHSSSQFMLQLIDDILEISTFGSGMLQFRFEPTDLVTLVRQNLVLNRLVARRKRVQLDLTTHGQPPLLLIDPRKMDQVIDKLVTNAIKFSYPDSRIEIRVVVRGGLTILSVQDHGLGFPAMELKTALRPSALAPGPLSPICGLPLVTRIVEGHGGKIRLESKLGKGSTVTVSLPIHATSPSSHQGRRRAAIPAA